jgi:hypothetical protein
MKQLLATIVAVYLNIYYEHRFTIYGRSSATQSPGAHRKVMTTNTETYVGKSY